MVRQGITSGYPGGVFKPTAPVTRQAMAAFLYRAKGSPFGTITCETAPFPDVPADHPFCGQILWLAESGISGGYDDGTFKPEAPVSRQAMAAFLYKASSSSYGPGGLTPAVCPPPDDPFPDVPDTHPFCGYIAVALDGGITTGYADGTFKPAAPVSRQAMASFLYRWRP